MSDVLPPPMSAREPEPAKSRNCWVVGCGGCLGGLALLVIAGMVLASLVMAPPFEPVTLSPAERAQAEMKFRLLETQQAEGRMDPLRTEFGQGLELTEQEVNYWISQAPDAFAGMLRLDFEPGEITARLRVGEGQGKRVQLVGRVSVKQTGDQLEIRLVEVRMGRLPLPASLMKAFQNRDLMQEIFPNPRDRELFETSIEHIEIEKDRIRVIPRKP